MLLIEKHLPFYVLSLSWLIGSIFPADSIGAEPGVFNGQFGPKYDELPEARAYIHGIIYFTNISFLAPLVVFWLRKNYTELMLTIITAGLYIANCVCNLNPELCNFDQGLMNNFEKALYIQHVLTLQIYVLPLNGITKSVLNAISIIVSIILSIFAPNIYEINAALLVLFVLPSLLTSLRRPKLNGQRHYDFDDFSIGGKYNFIYSILLSVLFMFMLTTDQAFLGQQYMLVTYNILYLTILNINRCPYFNPAKKHEACEAEQKID